MSGRSPAAAGSPPFWPWKQILEALAEPLSDEELRDAAVGSIALVGQLSERIAERLARSTVPSGDNPDTLRFLLYEAVSGFLERAVGSPLVIKLDDIQWADTQSLELLSYLTPSLGNRPLLIAAAYRDVASDRTPQLDATLATVSREEVVYELSLRGLAPEHVAPLVEDLLGARVRGDIDSSFIDALHQRTGGNPFFIRQLGRLLMETGGPPQELVGTAIPPGVRHVVARRIDALSERTVRFLESAATAGHEFDVRLAAAAGGMSLEEALDACDEARHHGLLQASDHEPGYRFVHALVQEVVRKSTPAGRALRLEAEVGVLKAATDAPVEEIAEHLRRARDLVGSAALEPQVVAADKAAAVFAFDLAERYLRRGLSLARAALPPDHERELSILLTLFRVIGTEKGWGAADAEGVVARARELAAAGGLRSGHALRLWWSLWLFLLDRDEQQSIGDISQAFISAAEGVSHAAVHAASELVQFFVALSGHGLPADATMHLRAARAAVDSVARVELATVDEHLDLMLLLVEGHLAALQGDLEAHRRCTAAATALAEADGRPFPRAMATTLSAMTASLVAPPELVAPLAERAVQLSQRFGFEWLNTLAVIVLRWTEAHLRPATVDQVASVTEQLEDLRGRGHHGNATVVEVLLADVKAQVGDVEGAKSSLQPLLEQPGAYGQAMVAFVTRRIAGLPR